MESEVLGLIAALARVLDARGLRWFLFGGQAAVLLGSPRLTLDVDVTVGLDLESAAGLVEELAAAGFAARVENPGAFVADTRVLPLFHGPSGLPVDLVVAGPGLEEEFLGRARRVEVSGVSFPLVTAEDFIIMKVLAGRPKDREDVVSVLARGAPLDRPYVVEKLRLLEAALDRGDLRALLESLDPR